MKKIMFAGLVLLALGTASVAQTPPAWPKTSKEARSFVQEMPVDSWTKVVSASISLRFFVGSLSVPSDFTNSTAILFETVK